MNACDHEAKLRYLEERLETIERLLSTLQAKKKPVKHGADWLAELKTNPLFAHVDFAEEERKIAIWKMKPKNVNRKITKAFWLNWLAKVDTAVPVTVPATPQPKAHVKVESRPVPQHYDPPPPEFWERVGRIGKGM